MRLEVSPAAVNPTGFYSQRFEALFPHDGTLGCTVFLAPQLFLLVYPHVNVGPPVPPASACPGPPATASPAWSSSRRLAASPLHLGCLPPPLLQVWMNVSSLTPWLSDSHTVRFPGSSDCFLFLNLLLFFFWLYEEAKFIYLCLYLGQKSLFPIF